MKICAIRALLCVFFNCVDSLPAYHNGAIIAIQSKKKKKKLFLLM